MTSRTVTGSVHRVDAPPEDLDALVACLDGLRARFPGAIFQRYLDRIPQVGSDCFIAPGAAIVGDVRLADASSVWFGCILRGDVNFIEVGPRSNLQDGTVVHLGDRDPTRIGADVVVGHRAVLHGCTVGDRSLIGIQSTVLDGAVIGSGCVVGAGALVPAGRIIPPNSLVLGTPGRVVRTLASDAADFHAALAAKYCRLHHNHRHG
ncbi:MAG: gamma carbonic anhydrase family protein [Myxococcota bacterium]|nr:gamma carbonic anhydrase family protein [Myxococcota bacterium]MEC8423096.1 gamma carbonic anhydrase family protein [Myxococcota bacterium]